LESAARKQGYEHNQKNMFQLNKKKKKANMKKERETEPERRVDSPYNGVGERSKSGERMTTPGPRGLVNKFHPTYGCVAVLERLTDVDSASQQTAVTKTTNPRKCNIMRGFRE